MSRFVLEERIEELGDPCVAGLRFRFDANLVGEGAVAAPLVRGWQREFGRHEMSPTLGKHAVVEARLQGGPEGGGRLVAHWTSIIVSRVLRMVAGRSAAEARSRAFVVSARASASRTVCSICSGWVPPSSTSRIVRSGEVARIPWTRRISLRESGWRGR